MLRPTGFLFRRLRVCSVQGLGSPQKALARQAQRGCNPGMDREVHIARSFADAERYDREQQWRMTPDERLAALAALRRRVYGEHCPDVRQAERQAERESERESERQRGPA